MVCDNPKVYCYTDVLLGVTTELTDMMSEWIVAVGVIILCGVEADQL